jgi:hypothetical protein
MAAIWADDFSRYGTGEAGRLAMLDGLVYARLGLFGRPAVSPDPNDDVRAYLMGNDPFTWTQDFRIALPTAVTSGSCGVAFRAWLSQLPGSGSDRSALAGFQRADGVYIVYMRIEQNGAITVQGRVSGVETQVFDSINPIVSPASFNHYELVHDKTSGEGSVYVNGVLRASYTGVDTADNLVFVNMSARNGPSIPTHSVWIKDLYLWNSSGAQNNSVAGTVIVRRYKPDGDNTLGGWVPSTGTTGSNLLAKDAPNDTTYLSADDAPPSPMSFTLENLPPDVTSVRCLISVVRVRKIDGGDADVQVGLSPNATDWDNGADRPMTSAFAYYFDVSELDPAVAGPWSPLAFDGAFIRVDRTL